jgi:hypothetical protein
VQSFLFNLKPRFFGSHVSHQGVDELGGSKLAVRKTAISRGVFDAAAANSGRGRGDCLRRDSVFMASRQMSLNVIMATSCLRLFH